MSLPADRHNRQPFVNEAGQVAMRYMRLIPTTVHCGPSKNGRDYAFVVKANINLSWVEATDVPCCLAVWGGCCGEKKPGVIIYASEADVRQWTKGGGR